MSDTLIQIGTTKLYSEATLAEVLDGLTLAEIVPSLGPPSGYQESPARSEDKAPFLVKTPANRWECRKC